VQKKPLSEQAAVVTGASWKKQLTGEDKPVDAPDNLFDTLPGDPGAHGRFDDQSKDSTALDEVAAAASEGLSATASMASEWHY